MSSVLADEQEQVAFSVGLLEERGVRLGSPHSSALKGTAYAFRELRTQAGGGPLRTVYAFDPARHAVLLIGGDKTGDAQFYERIIPIAETIWKGYLAETGQDKPPKK